MARQRWGLSAQLVACSPLYCLMRMLHSRCDGVTRRPARFVACRHVRVCGDLQQAAHAETERCPCTQVETLVVANVFDKPQALVLLHVAGLGDDGARHAVVSVAAQSGAARTGRNSVQSAAGSRRQQS